MPTCRLLAASPWSYASAVRLIERMSALDDRVFGKAGAGGFLGVMIGNALHWRRNRPRQR